MFPSVIDLAGAVRVGSTTAADVLEQHLARVDAREGEIHAFNLVTAETARRDAATIDAAVSRGVDPGPLAGVPIALIGGDVVLLAAFVLSRRSWPSSATP